MKRKLKFEIELEPETVDKLLSLTSVVNFLTKNTPEATPEDMIKAALAYYIKRFYETPLCEHQNPDDYIDLAKAEYPLKTRIAELIAKKSITATQFGEKLGLSKGTISGIVNGKHLPTLDVFIRIYIALGCPPINEILYRDIPD